MQNSVRSKATHSDKSQFPLGGFLFGSQESTNERFLQIGHISIGGSNHNEYGKFIECLGGAKSEKDRHRPRKRERLV